LIVVLVIFGFFAAASDARYYRSGAECHVLP
jgi:hypothetical protein